MQCVIIKDKFGKTIGAKTPNGVDSRLFTDIASLPFIEDNNKAATVLAATYNILPTLKTEVNGEPTIVFNTPKGTTQSYREALTSGAQTIEYGYENKVGAFVPVGEVSASLSEDNYHSVVNSAIASGVLAERKTFVNGRYVLVGSGEGVVPNVNANIVAQELRDKLGNVKVDNTGRIITPEKEVELPEVSERSELADSLINPLNYQPKREDLLETLSKGQTSIEGEDSIISPIVEALKNSGLASEVSLMSNEEMNELRGVNSTDGGVVKGAVIGDKVILNKDNMTLDTPIHEFGHLWNSVAKIKNEELYKQGLNLIEKEGQEYINYVKETQPKLKGEALLEEALAQAIGDSGARILNEKRSSNLNKWFKDFFDWLSDQLGISQYSGDTLKNLTLDQFATAVAIEIIRGDQNNPLNPIVTEQTIGDKKSSITFNYLEEKRIPELVKSGKVKIHNDLGFMSGYHAFTHSPDDTLGGTITFKREGKEDTIFEGLGGLYFTTIFDKIWAVKNNENGTSSTFKNKINQLRKVSKDGKVFFILIKGSDTKGLSNPQGVEAALQTVANLIHSGILKPSIVKENIIKAVYDVSNGKDSITLHKGVKTSDLIDDLMNYFHDDKKLSFERRGDVLKKLLQGIYADIKSDATTISKVATYMGTDNKLTRQGDFIDLFGKLSAEQRLKGLSTGDIYAAVEITHNVQEKEGKHKVFNKDLFMEDENGNEVDFVLHLIEGKHNMVDNLVDVKGNDLTYYINNPVMNARGEVKNPKSRFASSLMSWNAGGRGSGIVRPQVNMSVEQDPDDLQLSNSSNGTGASTQKFFGNVVTGGDARYEPSKPYEYEEEFFGTEKSFQDNYDQKMGNFDQHIATSIPTFRETQIKKGAAIVRLLGDKTNPVLYDLGGSEGSWIKTITEESNGNIKTINLDPSPEMQDSFNRNKPENSEMSLEAFYQGWDDVKTHQPKEKADIVHESMMFQFIDNDGERSDYIKEVKNKYLKDNGLFLTEEKFQMNSPSEYQANEELKVPHKDKYYTKEQQSLKADQVLVGMKKNQANYSQYLSELKEQFKYVQPYWFSGNFRGIVATDNKEMLDKFLREIGTTSNPAYTFSPTHKDVLRLNVAQNPFENPQKHPTKPGIKTVKIGNSTVNFREGAKKLTLEYIETERGTRKTGEATKALEAMKQYANQTHKEIHLFADPKDTVDNKALSEQKLIEFYRKNGFQSKYGHLENEMFYAPVRFSAEPVSTVPSEITQRQTVELNKDTKKSTPLYTNEDVYEVTDPKVYTDAMVDAIDEMKKDPKGDKSAQLTPLTEEEAADILNTGGRIFMTKDNMSGGYVNVDGYMGGLFRNPKGKGGVSRVLQDARVAVGGRFFDSFAVNEERYLQNGFRPLIRQDFNPRYAPENWENTTLKTRPDNVFFVYDPNYKATLGEGTRNNDYIEAYKQSKNFTPTPSIPTAAFNSIIDNMMKDPPEGFNMTCGI